MRLRLITAFAVLAVANVGAAEAPPGGDSGPVAATMVGVYDPTGQSSQHIQWPAYPAAPPAGFHWQHTGSLAIKLDPATRQPVPGQFTGTWILVRDGYSMPKMR